MTVYILKFIHIVIAISLLGSTFWCLTTKKIRLQSISRILLFLSIFAAITGTLLVHPSHFDFHTAWIRAAYLLIFFFILGVLILKFEIKYRWINQSIFLSLFILLVVITHDAVTKSTALFHF